MVNPLCRRRKGVGGLGIAGHLRIQTVSFSRLRAVCRRLTRLR